METGRQTRFVFNNPRQLLLGLAVLGFGALVYVSLRPPDQIYFTRLIGIQTPLFTIKCQALTIMGRSLPAFCHVFAFILITASFFRGRLRSYAAISAGWLLVDGGFELGQKYRTRLPLPLFDALDGIPFLESTRRFFEHGTFDPVDLAATVVGTGAAFIVLLLTSRKCAEAETGSRAASTTQPTGDGVYNHDIA